MAKIIIYQLLPRLFSNFNETRKNNGTIEENGCGKLNLITPKALREIKRLGATHIWYTGIIEHATIRTWRRMYRTEWTSGWLSWREHTKPG